MKAESCNGSELAQIAAELRGRIIEMSNSGEAPHLGSCLSCVDLLTVLYWDFLEIDPSSPNRPERDRFILSKGHAAMALYSTLARRGFFSDSALSGFNKPGSNLPEQPSPNCAPGVEWATGSLGHGLSVGIGLALSSRLKSRKNRIVVLLSDGECNEGSVWEAALFAPAQRLGNLLAIVDYNKWQATGRTNEVTAMQSMAEKWRAFGWNTIEVDGHNLSEIRLALRSFELENSKPTAIVAHTVKGKGVSFMEDDNNWHYRIPTVDEIAAARRELGLR